jgi:hypothetical protein
MIFYLIPLFFVELFHTLLGKGIFLCLFVLLYQINSFYGILFLISIIILYQFSNWKEPFQNQSYQEFLKIQQTINPNIVFDSKQLQLQVSQSDLNDFIKNKKWNWSEKTKNLYKEYVDKNPFVKSLPEDSLQTAMTIYNEQAILQLMALEEKEGTFLINGLSVIPSIKNRNIDSPFHKKIYRCAENKNQTFQMSEVEWMGKGGILGENLKQSTFLKENELEKKIPHFEFIKKECNPCSFLNNPPQYDCPFQLNNESPSEVWKYLWKI